MWDGGEGSGCAAAAAAAAVPGAMRSPASQGLADSDSSTGDAAGCSARGHRKRGEENAGHMARAEQGGDRARGGRGGVKAGPCDGCVLTKSEDGRGEAAAAGALPKALEDNALDAMTAGATRGVVIAANIGACLVRFLGCWGAIVTGSLPPPLPVPLHTQTIPPKLRRRPHQVSFLAVQAMLDAAVSWWFGLVGLPYVDLQFLLGKLLWVVAWLMGVDTEECDAVGRLIAVKTLTNEFVAYLQLVQDDTLSPRSVAIATYALCGFSNLGSVGIQLATLGVLAPERRQELTRMAWSALGSGFLACCLTACLASILLRDDNLGGEAR